MKFHLKSPFGNRPIYSPWLQHPLEACATKKVLESKRREMKNQKSTLGQPGFTLIELLVVIAIVGLLASIVLVGLNIARVKARDTQRVANIQQIMKALEFYYNTNARYPAVTAPFGVGAGKPVARTRRSGWKLLLLTLEEKLRLTPLIALLNPVCSGRGREIIILLITAMTRRLIAPAIQVR